MAPHKLVIPTSLKSAFVEYRTGYTPNDEDGLPIILTTPKITAAAYFHADPTPLKAVLKPIDTTVASRLIVRLRFNDVDANANVHVVGWGPEGSNVCGEMLAEFKADATARTDSTPLYTSVPFSLSVENCSRVYIFVSNVSASDSCSVDFALSNVHDTLEPFNHVFATYRIQPDSTATGKSIATLAQAISYGIKELMMIPVLATDDVRWNIGDASAITSHVPVHGVSLPITKEKADLIKLFCTNGADVTIIELG